METRLASWIAGTAAGNEADAILRSCVHCGFCLATCPTYQLLGDELDSPRGRIYQIKQTLEGVPPTRETQIHLDRCLTCRSCETTCPSGVNYGHLVDIGRAIVSERVQRPVGERFARWLIRESVTRPKLFALAVRIGRLFAWALPRPMRDKLTRGAHPGELPRRSHPRKVLLLNSCVQTALAPAIDAATARVLDAVGIECVTARESGCCGALRHHMDDASGSVAEFRRNIDAWWPMLEAGEVEAIVINASGCAAQVKEYGRLLANDVQYAQKALRISAATRDLSQFLPPLAGPLRSRISAPGSARVAFHPPCTLQHGMRVRGVVEELLASFGAQLTAVPDAHLCCGSAGSYSLLQPELARELRTRKAAALSLGNPEVVLSANIGCIQHLQGAVPVPVRHWIEWLDEQLAAGPAGDSPAGGAKGPPPL